MSSLQQNSIFFHCSTARNQDRSARRLKRWRRGEGGYNIRDSLRGAKPAVSAEDLPQRGEDRHDEEERQPGRDYRILQG